MSRFTRRHRFALTLLGVAAAAVLHLPVTAYAQPDFKAQFGPPTGVDPLVRIPAVKFTAPQAELVAPSGTPPMPPAVLAAPVAVVPVSPGMGPLPTVLFPPRGSPMEPPPPMLTMVPHVVPQAVPLAAPAVRLGFQELSPPVVVTDPDTVIMPGLVAPLPADVGASDPRANSAWLTNPPVQTIPRPGFFAVPPTGPGYYSLLDLLTGNHRDNAPAFGYPRSAIMSNANFDTDWRFVDQPGYDPDLLERLHRIHLGDNWLFATGGEFRIRYANEINSRLSGKDNDYDLTRLRVYGDLWYKDSFRVFVEFISAQSSRQTLTPLITDRDYADLLNAFVDVKIFEDADGVPSYVRAGRQQLLFGSQRLISPLDWANTMRTFDGVRVFRHSEQLDLDAFWSRVVIPDPTHFDTSDPQQNFAGAWMEYRPNKNRCFDLYYLYLADDDRYNAKTKTPVPVGQLPLGPYSVSTFGYRYAGNLDTYKNVLFDSENMLQLGRSSYTNSDIVAGASSTGLGYNFAQAPMNPTMWAYFDYGSGSRNVNLNSGQQLSTFNQLYPFGHYYFGWLDYVSRMNIQDWNFHLYLYPTKWVTFNAQYHAFMLDSAHDALYSAGGAVLRYDPTGKAGRDIGQELDFITNFHLTKRQDILVAYGHLFEGRSG
jgi:Alginate export